MKKNHTSKVLQLGAQSLIDNMKNPKIFLEFITEALDWVHNYEVANSDKEEKDSMHWHVTLLIKELILPWMASDKDNEIQILSNGLHELCDTFGFEGMRKANIYILQALGKDLDNGVPGKEWFKKYTDGIHALYELQECLENYEEEYRTEKQAA